MYSSTMYASLFREKLQDADTAVAAVTDGTSLLYATALAEPPAFLWALATRLRAGDLNTLKVFGGPPMQNSMDTVLALDLADRVERFSLFVGAAERGMV